MGFPFYPLLHFLLAMCQVRALPLIAKSSSVADLGCLSQIAHLDFFHPGSQILGSKNH
jgi:hypothetical protein